MAGYTRRSSAILRWALGILALVLSGTAGAAGQQPVLLLTPDQDSPVLASEYVYRWSTTEDVSIRHVKARDDQFKLVTAAVISESDPNQHYWYRINIKNTSEKPGTWYLTTGLSSPVLFRLYEESLDTIRELLSIKALDPYGKRPVDNRHLVIPVELEPLEEKTVYVNVHTLGLRLMLRFVTQSTLEAEQLYDHYVMIALVAGMTALLILNLAQFFATRIGRYFYYSNLVFWSLLTILQYDGYSFRYLWPDNPMLNILVQGAVGVATAVSLLQMVRSALDLNQRAPRLDRVIRLAIVAWFLLLPIMAWDASLDIPSKITVVVAPFSMLILAMAGYVSVKQKIPTAAWYMLGWLVHAVSLSLFLLMHSGLSLFSELFNSIYIYATGLAVEALLLSFALAHQVRLLVKREQRATSNVHDLLNDKMRDMEALLLSEHERSRALYDMKQTALRLASTSHDIRQPLFSIKAHLSLLKKEPENSTSIDNIDESVKYLTDIMDDAISESRRDVEKVDALVSLGKLFHELFNQNHAEAQNKKIALMYAPTSIYVKGSKLVFLRIIDNLIKNSIRYTETGKVLFGVRRRSNGVEIQVIDTGVGVSQSQLEKLTQPFFQGGGDSAEAGFGLGLSIVRTLCNQRGYIFSVESMLNKGSRFSILVPN